MAVFFCKFSEIFGAFEGCKFLRCFGNYYLRVEYLNAKKKSYKVFDKGDDTGEEVPFFAECKVREHRIRLESIESFFQFYSSKRFDYNRVFDEADRLNKIVVNFSHSNIRKAKFFIVKCKDCGTESVKGIGRFKNCQKCYWNKSGNTFEDFKLKGCEKHEGKYDYDGVDYINAREKVKIYCKKCKIYFWQRPCDHLYGTGCPRCCESKGEIAVRKYLVKLGHTFETQKVFPGLVHLGELKYDFYFEYMGKRFLIEFDGEHHFGPVQYSSDTEKANKNFEEIKIRDKKKNEYASCNGICLLRIPYWDMKKIPSLIDAFILENTRVREVQQLVLEM
jgi:hypothetical protein